jgi:hypothetical protein
MPRRSVVVSGAPLLLLIRDQIGTTAAAGELGGEVSSFIKQRVV